MSCNPYGPPPGQNSGINTAFGGGSCEHTARRDRNHRRLIGSEGSGVADSNSAAVIVTLLVMPHDRPGLP